MVDLTTFQYLDIFFNNIRGWVDVLEEELCDPRQMSWTSWDDHVRRFSRDELSRGQAVMVYPQGIASEEVIHGGAELFTPALTNIRRAFTFRNKILAAAKKKLGDIVQHYLKRMKKKKRFENITSEDCDIIGVHIRRTDHIYYEQLNNADPLSVRYFTQAMQTFAEKLKHPIFVIVTDDPGWARQEIHKSFRAYYTGFYNTSCQVSAGLDMAVLSLCNHLVLSRGTFGLWSSVLSGSTRIMPKHFLPDLKGKPLEVRNQVPLFDLSHRWMPEDVRFDLREHCPECLIRHQSNMTLLRGTDLVLI